MNRLGRPAARALAMHRFDADQRRARTLTWPAPTEVGAARSGPPPTAASYCYLLDVDADLAEEFDLRMRIAARQVATVLVFDVPVGRCDFDHWFAIGGGGPGLLVLDGVLAVDVRVGDRIATELVGASDLVQPPDPREEHLLAHEESWRALVPGRVAVLDAAFTERVRPWPQIMQALLRRAGRRLRDLNVQRTITSHPRLEVRLALLLWHLAARWGRVEPGGVRLSLPLTHALLGRLVGAERPSVSHALARLADASLVTGSATDWHLHGSAAEHVAALVGPLGAPISQALPRAEERRARAS